MANHRQCNIDIGCCGGAQLLVNCFTGCFNKYSVSILLSFQSHVNIDWEEKFGWNDGNRDGREYEEFQPLIGFHVYGILFYFYKG